MLPPRSPPASPPASRRALGAWGEQLACAHLRARGYRILARNLHLRRGELDIVALDGDALCFVEVRTRRGHSHGGALDSIDARKRARLVRSARLALATHHWPRHERLRFDVVAVDASSEPVRVRLIRDAFYSDRE